MSEENKHTFDKNKVHNLMCSSCPICERKGYNQALEDMMNKIAISEVGERTYSKLLKIKNHLTESEVGE